MMAQEDHSMRTCQRQIKKGNSRNLRKCRLSIPGCIYHVRASTLYGRPHFNDFALARMVIRCIAVEQRNVDTLAFCLMPNHLHWLFQLGKTASLDEVVQAVKSVSSHRINKLLGRKGELWQDGYFDTRVRRPGQLDRTMNYIIANPLKAGLVSSVWDYPHWDAKWLPEWVLEGFEGKTMEPR